MRVCPRLRRRFGSTNMELDVSHLVPWMIDVRNEMPYFIRNSPANHIGFLATISQVTRSRHYIHSFIHSFIHQWIYSALLGPGLFFSFVIIFTHGRIPWTSDQPVSRPLPTDKTTRTQYKRTHRHPCFEWDSNPRFQRSSERRQLMP
jgi:hypothetical protein